MTLTTTFPDEVVTHAKVRYVDLPRGAGTSALITLDNGFDHTKPNTFGPAGLLSLDAALEEVSARSDLAAVAVTGKPFILAVGADLKGLPLITTRAAALEIGRLGHRVFRRLGELGVPSFGLVNGAAMGGGLEVALHCSYRTVSSAARGIALPECFLGLVPGWGGTQLLANIVGAHAAVTVLLENALNNNRMLDGTQLFDLGVADAMFDGADFLERSLDWVAQVVTGLPVEREPVDRGEAWDTALAHGRALVDGKVHGGAPAPYRALELLELARTADRDAGFAAEDEALADLIMSEELRAGLYAFDLVQHRAKHPAGAPERQLARPVTKVGVIGAGLMASQLALLFARRLEVPVVLTDIDAARVESGVAYVHGEVDKLLAKGRIGQDKANRLKGLVSRASSKDAFADADFVIEAVFEDLAVKRQVFAECEAVVSDTCVLATNTSSLTVGAMAEGLAHPERVVGFHFFNPVAVLPLLEVIRAPATDDPTLATAFAVGKQLKKSCVLAADAPAFVVNRLLTRFLGEITAAIDAGTPIETADHALDPLGLPMSPLVLLQLVGPPIALHVAEQLADAFPDRYSVSPNLRRLVEAGKSSVYIWDGGTPTVDPEVAALFGSGDHPSSADEVRERALAALAGEARLMLDEKVVAEAQDIDLAMLLGAGWPFHLGGITPYLDRTGTSKRVTGGRFLPTGAGSLPD